MVKEKQTNNEPTRDLIMEQLYARTAELATLNKTLSLLRRLDEIAIETLEPDILTEKICQVLVHEFNFRLAGVMLKDGTKLRWSSLSCEGKKGLICPLNLFDIQDVSLKEIKHPAVKALICKRKQTTHRVSELFPNVSVLSLEKMYIFAEKQHLRTIFTYPLYSEYEEIGTLVIGINREDKGLTHVERETIKRLLIMIVVAIQKAQAHVSLCEITEKLQVANKKLKEADVLKTEFLSIASHELRTPLAVIKGYILTLQGGMLGKVSSKQASAIETIATSAERLIFLVNHLLDVTRIESDRLSVHLVSQDIVSILKDAVNFVSPLAKEKQLTLKVDLPTKPIIVLVDIDRTREIFVNLLDNAIKYTQSGGVEVKFMAEERMAIIQFKDTGFGLSNQDKRHLFEKFAQGSASKYVKTTTGLGLYVVKKLVEAMNGSVTADSAGLGKGSVFTVRFPVVSAKISKSK